MSGREEGYMKVDVGNRSRKGRIRRIEADVGELKRASQDHVIERVQISGGTL